MPVRLETERDDVLLESWNGDLKAGLLRAADDERINQFMTDRFPYPYTDADADEWLKRCEQQDPKVSFATLVDGIVAGGVGGELHDDIGTGSAEIGWWLSPAHWGQGVTTVAVRRYIRYCFEDLGLHRVDAGVFVPNRASARVAEKVGLLLEGVAVDGYRKNGELFDRLQFGLAKRDWGG
jgi:RimJ/RimL family protein N-acetyltransferase